MSNMILYNSLLAGKLADGSDFSPTTDQLTAMNSGITSDDVEQIETNKNNISTLDSKKMVFVTKGYYLSQLNWTAMGTGMFYSDAESVAGISKIYAVSYTGASNLRTTDVIIPTATTNNTKVALLSNTDTFANANATVTITIIGTA